MKYSFNYIWLNRKFKILFLLKNQHINVVMYFKAGY